VTNLSNFGTPPNISGTVEARNFNLAQTWTVVSTNEQDAQLSQRDRAAGCVIVFAKSKRLELEDNILWTL